MPEVMCDCSEHHYHLIMPCIVTCFVKSRVQILVCESPVMGDCVPRPSVVVTITTALTCPPIDRLDASQCAKSFRAGVSSMRFNLSLVHMIQA